MDYKKFNKQRKAEKRGEFLLLATERMSQGREKSAMGLLLAALENYDAKYNVVKSTLKDWVANGKLQKDFLVPETLNEFKKMHSRNYLEK